MAPPSWPSMVAVLGFGRGPGRATSLSTRGGTGVGSARSGRPLGRLRIGKGQTDAMMPHMAALLVLLAWLLASAAVAADADIVGGPTRVVDGDTLIVAGQRVRLLGIDAPERKQSCRRAGMRYQCGTEATQALRRLIGRGTVICTIHGTDRYGRALGVCQDANGIDLNGWLVQQGWALAYRRYSTTYVPQEDQAKAARAGIWAGEFVPPWAWRRGQRLA